MLNWQTQMSYSYIIHVHVYEHVHVYRYVHVHVCKMLLNPYGTQKVLIESFS